MRRGGLEPRQRTYRNLLEVFGRVHDVSTLRAVFDEMKVSVVVALGSGAHRRPVPSSWFGPTRPPHSPLRSITERRTLCVRC